MRVDMMLESTRSSQHLRKQAFFLVARNDRQMSEAALKVKLLAPSNARIREELISRGCHRN